MSDFNSEHNRLVWFDLPVADVDRAAEFYARVLGVSVPVEQYEEQRFAVIDHGPGNGGCLIPMPEQAGRDSGLLIYFNAEGRIREAVAEARKGGEVLSDVTGIGPHGFRAIIRDSEGNRVALHANTDA